jgi:hypothetical protein
MYQEQEKKFVQLLNKVQDPPHGGLASRTSELFQDQPWYIKLWRYRYYLLIPYHTFLYRYFTKMSEKNWKYAFSIAIGDAQVKMRWLYTLEEVITRRNNKEDK